MMNKLCNMIINIIKYGRVTKSLPDSGNFAKVQCEYEGKTKDVGVVFPYGTHGIVPSGSFILLNNVKASEESQAGIAFKPDIRPKLNAEGEYVVGNFLTGSIIKFLQNGDIEITGKNDVTATIDGDMNITITGDANITTTGDVNVTSTGDTNITSTGDTNIVADNATITATTSASITAPTTTVTGTLVVTVDAIIGGKSFLAHVHTGVTPGVGTSGPPL